MSGTLIRSDSSRTAAGGKAIATTFGGTLPFAPLLSVFYLGFIVGIYLIFRRMNLAGLIGALLLPVVAFYLLQREGWFGDELFTVVTGLLPVALIGAVKHVQAWLRERRRHQSDAAAG